MTGLRLAQGRPKILLARLNVPCGETKNDREGLASYCTSLRARPFRSQTIQVSTLRALPDDGKWRSGRSLTLVWPPQYERMIRLYEPTGAAARLSMVIESEDPIGGARHAT